MKLILLALLTLAPLTARHKLVVISVDGLDHRYLRDYDALGLKIPNMRRLIAEGQWAGGVVGVVPTVTWPSHTTLITGVPPRVHGILDNHRPAAEGGDYYWTVDLLKVKTLWHAARRAGLKTAAITWPVTGGADIDFNLPEYFKRRNGGAMDLDTIEAQGTKGLVEEIARAHPSFAHEWMDDRSRALATVFLMKQKRADLILLHFVDHDSEAHERGPFSREAKAVMEYTDELIGSILKAGGSEYVVALVSDHGFERIDRIVHLGQKLPGAAVEISAPLAIARDEAAAAAIRKLLGDAEAGIGREIPPEELRRFLGDSHKVHAAFEPAAHVMFGSGKGAFVTKAGGRGSHGLWPGRNDYRSVFALWGPGVKAGKIPPLEMTGIAARLAAVLDLKMPF